MSTLICPKCSSYNLSTERRMDGLSTCLDCGFHDKTSEFRLIEDEPNNRVYPKQVLSPEEMEDIIKAHLERLGDKADFKEGFFVGYMTGLVMKGKDEV